MKTKPRIVPLVLVLNCLVSSSVAIKAQPNQQSQKSQNRVMVDIGGHSLEVVVVGQGEPAVVFEAGFIGGIGRLRSLQNSVASQTLTLAYERAGLGRSEPGPEPRSATQVAQELRALLQKLAISGPVIIVGHSAGGFFSRVFAHRYPDQVAGLVLVDPATEDAYSHWRTTEPIHWAGFEQEVRQKYNPPSGWYGQWKALPQSIDEARIAWPIPSVPVAVFSAPVPFPDEWLLADEARIDVWLEAHRKLVGRIPNAKHFVVKSTDHLTILDHPDLQRTILEMIESVRTRKRPK